MKINATYGTAERISNIPEIWYVVMLDGSEYVSRFESRVRRYLETSERHESIHPLLDWLG